MTPSLAYRGYQGFVPGETMPEIFHKNNIKLAQRLWDDRYNYSSS